MRTINTFRIYCFDDHCSQFESETWVTTAIERNVQNLDLFIISQITEKIPMLPVRLFTCKTLVDLRLGWCTLPPFGGVTSLPSLKKIYLEYVEYLVDDALPRLLSGCPVLDELIFEGFLVANCYIMSSPTIKRLMVDFTYNISDYSRDYKVEINAPALKYLELVDGVASHISARTLTSLIEAEVVFVNETEFEDDQYYLSVLRFVDRLCKVKRLKLAIALVLPSQIKSIARFDNCTRLELDADWVLLTKFLESADNLEILVIRKVWFYGSRNWIEPKQVPTCMLSCLGMVRVDQFDCTEAEFEMVRYFLMNAIVLERMEIHIRDDRFDLEAKLDATQRIALFQRGSEACELAFN
ncbi:fbd-associated F-box protein at5g22730 [Phtheirospermum japonicum]|uniref:Fbd-associated F-box protein at5g22730 n=1 Tax=Phtheirospermum japonicum TaxID=374723 RepID=A0A830DBP9_9LAMI|nr:fbd-associated F-box protein at5g22730 [Phtheirospermum japonicum]